MSGRIEAVMRHTSYSSKLEWLEWDEQAVVFNPRSGDTHLLNLVERTALECLDEGSCIRSEDDMDALAIAVSSRLDISADQRLRQYLRQLVTQFDELGLIVDSRDERPAGHCG